MAAVEQEKVSEGKLSVTERPESPAIPEHIEKGGVSPRATQFTAQVSDDKGQPLIQTPASSVTITLPADEEKLKTLSKGSVADAITWFARFWLRMIKKAAYLGWKVVKKS
ncbi:hypothetical protein HYT59_01300 [Candidatus Woesebacteria bacterium]|nr:hypothetical protein [Candidatus Woesebacteria bacterium]